MNTDHPTNQDHQSPSTDPAGEIRSLREELARCYALLRSMASHHPSACIVHDHLPVGFQLLDERARLTAVNSEWLRLLGYSSPDIEGIEFEHLLADRHKDSFRNNFRHLVAGGLVHGLEMQILSKDRSYVTVEMDAKGLTDETGRVLCIIRDITERKRIQKAIARAKREWEQTFDAVPDLVAILDTEHRIVRLNKAMAHRLRLDIRQAVGQVCHRIVHGADGPPCFCPHQKLLKDGQEHMAEFHEPNMNGHFLVTASPLFDERGELMGSVHVARDITERKLNEEALKKARDELETRVRERTEELYQANQLLEEKIRTIDQLYEHIVQAGIAKAVTEHTGEVAHELRQPLAIIGGFAQRMDKKCVSDDPADRQAAQEFARIIVKEVQRLEKILARLIDFTKRERLGLRLTSPNRLIEEVARVSTSRLQEKGIKLSMELDEGVGEILLDPERFEQVVRSLLASALEASLPRQTIRIETQIFKPDARAKETGELDCDTYFEMKVSCAGKIMDPGELEKVFNPFSTTGDFGSSLWLILAKRIVEEHHGSFSVKSDGHGTLFTVWMPVDMTISDSGCFTIPRENPPEQPLG